MTGRGIIIVDYIFIFQGEQNMSIESWRLPLPLPPKKGKTLHFIIFIVWTPYVGTIQNCKHLCSRRRHGYALQSNQREKNIRRVINEINFVTEVLECYVHVYMER